MAEIFPLLFLIGIAVVGGGWVIRWLQVTRLPTVNEYLAKHPGCRKRNGVACSQCGSTSIYLWWLYGPQAGRGPKKHICRTCGTALWHSR